MKLFDVCKINPRQLGISDDTLVSFVAMPDVSEDGKINTSVIRPFSEVKKGYSVFQEGDILFAKITPCMENGKGALAAGLKNGIGVGSTEFHVLRPNPDRVNGMWIYYLTAWPAFRHEAESHMTGSAGQRRVPKSFLEEYPLSVPSLNTQHEQVEHLNRVNKIIESRKEQLCILDQLIKARFVELFGDPEFNSLGWPIKQLGELCTVGSSKRIYQDEQSTQGIPFWRISDLVSKMDTGVVAASLYIPEERYNDLKGQSLVPEPGDILVTSRGTLGRCYIVSKDDRFYFQDGMISWLSNYAIEVTPLYIQYLFDMPGFRKQIDSMQAGSTVAYLSIAMLKKLSVMLPDLESQEQFATFVSQVDKSKLSIQASLDRLETLKQSLMKKYFE